jgi:hypothetical protein
MAKATDKTFKPGDEVRVVLADRKTHALAKITRMNKDGTANLEFVHKGQEMEITSAPFDESGTRPDCFLGCADAPAAAEPTGDK